jgi:hypothetical protein
LIAVRTHIGFGSPHKQDTAAAHGEALGVEEVRLTKEGMGWPAEAFFHVPEEALEHFREAVRAGSPRSLNGSRASKLSQWSSLTWRRSFIESSTGACPRIGTPTCRHSVGGRSDGDPRRFGKDDRDSGRSICRR